MLGVYSLKSSLERLCGPRRGISFRVVIDELDPSAATPPRVYAIGHSIHMHTFGLEWSHMRWITEVAGAFLQGFPHPTFGSWLRYFRAGEKHALVLSPYLEKVLSYRLRRKDLEGSSI